MGPSYNFTSKLWLYGGESSWYFITLPEEYAAEIKSITTDWHSRGFGSVQVIAKIGDAEWETSIFPDTKTKSYLLPIKKEVRAHLNAKDADQLQVSVKLKNM